LNGGAPRPRAPAPAGAIVLRARTLEAAGIASAVFTTRQGGTSAGPWRSLNLSYAVRDAPAAVGRNRRLAAAAVGVDPRCIVEAQQVHGARVAIAGPQDAGRTLPGVDALLTDSPGVWLAVHTADCVALLVVDPARPAVAAVHAGWRGIASGVVPAALAGLAEAYDTVTSRCLVALGPSIGPCCYEVDRLVANAMGGASWWPIASEPGGRGKWYLDLRAAIRSQLIAVGVDPGRIEATPGCTRCQPDLYFSYRRERETGRMAACVGLCGRA
jgi:YfiH family protein